MSTINLGIIETEVKSQIHNAALTDAQIDRWANIIQDRIVRAMDPSWLEMSYTFDTVATQREYWISRPQFRKITSVVDEDNGRVLTPTTEKNIDWADPDHSNTGSPSEYALGGIRGFQTQLLAADHIHVISSSAADVTQTVHIEGKDATGHDIDDTITITGVGVATGTTSFTTLDNISKSAATAGVITVSKSDNTTILTYLEADACNTQYMLMAIWPTPTAVTTIRVRYMRKVREMVDDQDEPDLPESWQDLVLTGTMAYAHEFEFEFERGQALWARFNADIAKLGAEMGNSRDNNRKIKLQSLISGPRLLGRLPDTVG